MLFSNCVSAVFTKNWEGAVDRASGKTKPTCVSGVLEGGGAASNR